MRLCPVHRQQECAKSIDQNQMNTRLILIIVLSTLMLSLTQLSYVQAPPGGHPSAIKSPTSSLGHLTKPLEQKQEDSDIVGSYVLVIIIAVALLIFFKKRSRKKTS